MRATTFLNIEAVYPIVVDYRQSLRTMITAGRYHKVCPEFVPENFPLIGDGIVELEAVLLYANRTIAADDKLPRIVEEMIKLDLEPGNLDYLLAIGAQYWKGKWDIMAPGTLYIDSVGSREALPPHNRYVPCLVNTLNQLDLSLYPDVNSWDEYWRLLAVRKK